MSRIKATVQFFHAWRHPDQIALEVEEELQFHIAKRTLANIENGMTPNEAQLAARQSFGHFHQIKTECCEIRRDLPFDARPLRMGIYIAIESSQAEQHYGRSTYHTITSQLFCGSLSQSRF